jgi:hypothetical protein
MFPRRGRYLYRVAYTYTYEGEAHRARCAVNLPGETPVVQPGESVTVLVHRDKPHRTLVPALYNS